MAEGDEKKSKTNKKEEEETNDQENPDINNLMTVDVDEMMNLYWGLTRFSFCIFEVGIILYMIYR